MMFHVTGLQETKPYAKGIQKLASWRQISGTQDNPEIYWNWARGQMPTTEAWNGLKIVIPISTKPTNFKAETTVLVNTSQVEAPPRHVLLCKIMSFIFIFF